MAADAVPKTNKPLMLGASQASPEHNANPGKFFTNFLYKATLVTVFLVLLPLFPSLAPDFIHRTLHARSWELFQLIFVGIAVSYGLFSKKNDETDKDHGSKIDNTQYKDHGSKIDNTQSYVSKLLQVSSFFDDEFENPTQTSSSQYYRGKPVVMVAKESPVVKEGSGIASEISQRPLLLPVRSLKQRAGSADEESNGKNISRSGSKRYTSINSRKLRNVDVGGLDFEKLEEKEEEHEVLRSPVPWRSRSGRMEMKVDGDELPSFASIKEKPESKRIEKSTSFSSSSHDSSPKNLSPSPSVSAKRLSPFPSESQAKSSENAVRTKIFSPSPPAPPPPPPPQFLRKSVLTKSNSSVANNADSPEKVLRRSVRSVPESEREELPRRTDPRIQSDGSKKSVRTFRPSELVMGFEKQPNDFETRKEQKKKKNEIIEKVLVETTDDESDTEIEDDDYNVEENSGSNAEADQADNSINDGGPDVDKKADEFIAKFREQIRLQRIESIRRSTAQSR